MASNRDLTQYQDAKAIEDAFSALVSGKKFGYKTVIERKKDIPSCGKCRKMLSGEEKFCPECGNKIGQ